MMKRLVLIGVLLLVLGTFTYFFTNHQLTGMRIERSVFLPPHQSVSFSVPYSSFVFGFHPPNLTYTISGGYVVNGVSAVIPFNGTYLNATAYFVQSYGSTVNVEIINNGSQGVDLVYVYKDNSNDALLVSTLNAFGLVLDLFGIVSLALGLLIKGGSQERAR
ncbi:MAG: hypothetical protein ACP5HQ_00815 [Thermoprotei archaeon]